MIKYTQCEIDMEIYIFFHADWSYLNINIRLVIAHGATFIIVTTNRNDQLYILLISKQNAI